MEQPTVLFDDDAILVINKPAGWVVHEGAGDQEQTIVDWFVKDYPDVMSHEWEDLTRVGIVHRLDKDTSGAMVLAKSPEVLKALQSQFKEREVKKEYYALLFGLPPETSGRIETFIGRNPKHRQEQTVLPIQQGEAKRREAVTRYELTGTFSYKKQPIAEVLFYPETGRKHQLRVHAKFLGTPIIGDQVYTIKPAKRLSKELGAKRQMLHAIRLTLRHPKTGETKTFRAPLPSDMKECQSKLERTT